MSNLGPSPRPAANAKGGAKLDPAELMVPARCRALCPLSYPSRKHKRSFSQRALLDLYLFHTTQ